MIKKKSTKLRIIPLGGLGEIGKNMTAIEYGSDMIIIDCGLAFPDEDMLGIDTVIPDMSYIEANSDKLRGFLITHGHEDHIGAMPYALGKFKVPVYGTKFTLALIEHKLDEHNMDSSMLCQIELGDTLNIGCFKIEFIKVSHSIAGAVGLAIHTPVGYIIHTGDFKVDYTPIDGEPIDINRFAYYGSKGVLALLMDSTNAELTGVTPSEQGLMKTFEKVFYEAPGKIIVASFASNVYRIQQFIDIAIQYNRVLCFQGRSMINIVRIAKQLGYLRLPEEAVIELSQIKNYDDKRICVLTTGSQGESMSGLFRMANASHKLVIGKGDTIIISASTVPGNEKSVGKIINQLFQRGANVVYDRLADVHVSGHARQEELKLMLTILKPKFFIPVHGEARQLYRHAMLAEKVGIKSENIFVMENGNVLELDKKNAKLAESVPAGALLIDGLGVGDVGETVLRERRLLSQDGLFAVVMPVNHTTGEFIGLPEIITRGFIYVKDSEEFMNEARDYVFDLAMKTAERFQPGSNGFKAAVKSAMKNFLFNKTKRTPIVLPIVVEIDI